MTQPSPTWPTVWDAVNKLKDEVDNLRLTVATMNPDFRAVCVVDDNLKKVYEIKRAVCDAFNLREHSMTQRRKTEEMVWPRQIAMALTRESTTMTLTAIGKCFGNRDHGTVLHAIERVKEREAVEEKSRKIIENLRAIIAVTTKEL